MLAIALLCSGCARDPAWFGYWEIVEARRDAQVQSDMGTLELRRDQGVAVFLRYRWEDGGFSPDPGPEVVLGESDAEELEIIDGYAEKDEQYTLWLSPFCVDAASPLEVVTYGGGEAVLAGRAQPWPGAPPDELLPIELYLRR